MSVPEKLWLHFIVDSLNRSLYVENGIIKRSSPPVPLPQLAKGWKDIEISFGTNQKYWNLQRSFTVPMFFVGDGADICRDAIYSGKGYEEELYILILKLNYATGIYDIEYKGRLDFSKNEDEPRKGITVNSIEGGVLTKLIANDSVPYELPLDPSNNTGVLQVMFDGVNMQDKYRYSIPNVVIDKATDFDHHVTAYTIPLPFISNDGDSIGVIAGSQMYEEVAASGTWTNSLIYPYTSSSANYCYSSLNPLTLHVKGTIKFRVNRSGGAAFGVHIGIQTSTNSGVNGNGYPLLGAALGDPGAYILYPVSEDVTVLVDTTIPLLANEKAFLIAVVSSDSVLSNNIEWQSSDLFFSFQSKAPASSAFGLSIIDVHKQLIKKMTDNKYTGDSVYFSNKTNLIWTSTTALQNYNFQYYYGSFEMIETAGLYQIKIPGPLQVLPAGNQLVINGAVAQNGVYTVLNISSLVLGYTTITVFEPVVDQVLAGTISTVPNLKLSWQDFFNDVDCIYNIGIKIVNDVVFIEPKASLYDDDAEIFDIGEIANLKIRYASELLCNTATFGYKSQDYRQRNGIYEFNTTTNFKLPVDTLKKDYTKILKARADCFGIEFIRSNSLMRPTQDNTGDNQPFIVNTTLRQGDVAALVSFLTASPQFMIVPNNISFVVGDVFTITGSVNNNFTLTVTGVGSIFLSQVIFVTGGPLVTENLVNVFIDFQSTNSRVLFRETYDSISGVLDNTVFNIEELTPHRLLLAHGNYLKSLLVQLPTGEILFKTADKNSALSTTLAGVTIAERQTEIVSSLAGDILFYPWVAEFTTPVPLSFAKVMSNIGTGYIKGTFYGQPLYFLPIGKMDAKPGINAAQTWSLLLAPKNQIATIKSLSLEGLFTLDVMGNSIFTTDLNPLHFNKYNYSLAAKYQHKEIYDDQFQNRTEDFLSQPYYCQKFQKTENIPIQVITNGLADMNVELYDSDGFLVNTFAMVVSADPAVLLPYVLWNYSIVTSGLAEGIYFVVISSGATKLRISEYIEIRTLHEKTLLFEYSHSTNKYATYFGAFAPNVRVEATMLPWFPESSFEPYTDELADFEVLDGIPVAKRSIRIGNSYGVPDWMALKISRILLLNQCSIDGVRYSRTPDSKFTKKEIQGHPMNSYLVEISKSTNHHGLGTNEAGTESDVAIAYTLNGQAFGMADPGSTINIEIPIEP